MVNNGYELLADKLVATMFVSVVVDLWWFNSGLQ